MKEIYNLSIVIENGMLRTSLKKGEGLELFKQEVARNINCEATARNITANIENNIHQKVIKAFENDYAYALSNKNGGKKYE